MSMNIKLNNIYNKNQDFKVPKKRKPDELKSPQLSQKDDFTISQQAQDLQSANNIAKSTPDVRENKVNEIQELIKSGNYQVDLSKIADKILGY